MSSESRELVLFAANDENLYRQRIHPVLKNLAIKKAKGTYDPTLALKLWKYVADDAAQRYTKENGGSGNGTYGIFTPADRRDAAKDLQEEYAENLEEFHWRFGSEMPKKYRAKNPVGKRSRTFEYYIDLDERGEFRADVRNFKGDTVFEIEGGEIFEDGFMRNKNDTHGLREHLISLGIMREGDHLIMGNPHRRKVHTAKFDRCVEAMSERGSAVDPYAVCQASLGESAILKKHRRGNPDGLPKKAFILAAYGRNKNDRAYYTGSTFDDNPLRAKFYKSPPVEIYSKLKNKIKRGWKLVIEQQLARQQNPVAPLSSKIHNADMLYRDFSGDAPEWTKKVKVDLPSVALAFGTLDAVEYTTNREGETQLYRHRFKKSARPTLAVGGEGFPLLILGGNYKFTERGITDE